MNLTLPKTYFKFLFIAMLFLGQIVVGQISVTNTAPITQNFNGLSPTAPVSWTNNSTPLAGWYSTTTTLNPNPGTTNSNNVYNCGTASNSDRALGALSTSTTHNFGVRLKNNSALKIISLDVTFVGEQWRQNSAAQTLTFDYQIASTVTSITAGTWTSVTALNFLSPNTGSAGALDGNLTANRTSKNNVISLNIPAGSEIMLRWTKAGSSSHLLAIDDLVIVPSFETVGPAVTTTSNAGLIDTTNAYLTGTINANGITTNASFDYGTTVSYGSTATASPSSVSGTTTTDIDAVISSLSINTQYHYRAVGTVGAAVTNGADRSFYTLAATPGTVAVGNPQLATLSVEIDNVTQNGNPANTQYAIQTGTQYVQANGSLGATAVWQTAATWGYKTVTGLTSSTNYTFRAKARNGDNVETVFGADASETTLTPLTVDYNVVQFPNTAQTITEGTSFTVYIRAYENGITTTGGASARLKGWVGYSSTNDNPANAGWTWIPATFNVQVGNDDEYQADIPNNLLPGIYYYAARFEIDDSMVYTYGGASGNWNNNSVTLTVNADVVDFCNIQSPLSGTITEGMSFDIYAQVYEAGVTNPSGQAAGITAQIGYSTTNGTPDGTWTWLTATYNTDFGNNDEYKTTLSGLTPGTYYYASRFIKTGSTTYVYGGTNGSPWSTSGVLTVNALGTPVATAGTLVGATSFTANWDAVTNATSYELDVSTSPTFSESTSGSLNEGFENGLPTGSYVTTPTASTLDSGEWTLSNVLRATTAKSGSYSMQLRSPTNNGIAISPSNANVTNLTFYARRGGSGLATTETEIYKIVSGVETLVSTIDLTVNFQQFSIPINQIGEDVKIKFRNTGGNIALIDDVVINYGSTTPSFVLGYEDLNVGNVTSYSVTGLDPETTYYYRVRAILGTVTSPNSNVIDVTTTAAAVTSCTWDGSAWSNTTGPDATLDAIIEGVYSTGVDGEFTAKSITVNTGSLTINSGNNLIVVEGLTNNLTAADVVVESNANLLQAGSTNTNVGEITVKRNSAAIQRLDYTLWSSPVTGQGLYAFSPTTLPNRFYVYNPNTNQYSNAVGFDLVNLQYPTPLVAPNGINGTDNNNVEFAQATGYLIRTPYNHSLTPTTFAGTFAGVANNGDITVSGLTNGLYYAVGNPYPSTIDADQFILDNSIGDNPLTPGDGLYFWRKTNNASQATNPTASYATYTTAGGVKSGGDTLDIVPSGVIQVGEGFIVKTTATSLVFNNDQRIANNDDQFLKTSSVERHRIWLNLASETSIVNQMMVSYMTGATQGIDAAIDGRFFNDSPTALNSLVNNEEFSIQGRSLPFESTDVVALVFKTAIAGTYSIAIDQVDGIFSNANQNIFLKDNLLNVEHNLRNAPYSFATEAGSFTNRFEIVYQSTLSVSNPIFENGVVVYSKNKVIEINTGLEAMATVRVIDVRGSVIAESKAVHATTLSIPLTQVANQVLIVQITAANGQTVSKKIVH